MTREEFWAIIDASRCGCAKDAQAEALAKRLSFCSPQELADFDRHLYSLMAESHSWNLWGAAYLINGGCSDDGFDYFRGWLIAQGRSAFEGALVDPDAMADLECLDEDLEFEDIFYMAHRVHEEKAGEEIPADVEHAIRQPDLGAEWDFDDDEEMKQRYPRLFARFC